MLLTNNTLVNKILIIINNSQQYFHIDMNKVKIDIYNI